MSLSAPPRIAVVLKGYPRLSETFIAQELLALEARGLPLAIWSLRRPTDPERHPMHEGIRAPVAYLPEYLHEAPLRVLAGALAALARPHLPALLALFARDLVRDPSASRLRRLGQALVLARELPAASRHLHAHFLHTPASVARYCAVLTGRSWSFSAHAKDIWTTPDWELAEKLADAAWGVTCTRDGLARLAGLMPADPTVPVIAGEAKQSRDTRCSSTKAVLLRSARKDGAGLKPTNETRPRPDRNPHPEAPARSVGLEGALQPALRSLEGSFEAADAAPQDEGEDGMAEGRAAARDRDRLALAYHGLDLTRFPPPPPARPPREGADPADPLRLVCVGRLVEKKGHDDLLAALGLLPAGLHWRLDLIGGGERRAALQARADALGFSGRIAFRGALAQPAVIAAMRAADLFVLPTKAAEGGDRDGLPNVLMEAASQELPILASAFAGTPEFVEHGRHGWLVPPGDPAALAAALLRLARAPAERARLGQAARARLVRDFAMEAGIDRIAARLSASAGLLAAPRPVLREVPACAC